MLLFMVIVSILDIQLTLVIQSLYNGYKDVTLVGPFQFESISVSNRVRQEIHHDHWIQLAEACKLQGILLPIMETRNSHKPSKIQDKGKRKSMRKR